MNLFKGPKQESTPVPTIDEAQQRVASMRRGQALRGRAANMLSTGASAPTAQRTVTGN